MSKASEWAKEFKPPPEFKAGLLTSARVADDGRLSVSGFFTPEEAIALAHWILDMFGESE